MGFSEKKSYILTGTPGFGMCLDVDATTEELRTKCRRFDKDLGWLRYVISHYKSIIYDTLVSSIIIIIIIMINYICSYYYYINILLMFNNIH